MLDENGVAFYIDLVDNSIVEKSNKTDCQRQFVKYA